MLRSGVFQAQGHQQRVRAIRPVLDCNRGLTLQQQSGKPSDCPCLAGFAARGTDQVTNMAGESWVFGGHVRGELAA